MRVTLDTNVFAPVADLSAYPNCPDAPSCAALQHRIQAGAVTAFVSEASLTLEALSHEQRIDDFFREWATKGSGIRLPTPHPKRLQVVEDLLKLGVKVLRVPNIALGSFVTVADTSWAPDEQFPASERQSRHSRFVRSFPERRPSPLKQLGASLVTAHQIDTSSIPQVPNGPAPECFLWIEGIVAEFDNPKQFKDRVSFVKHVRDLVAEWCDLDILASHYAYGNDYFCTFDAANATGTEGVLHGSNRATLKLQFGIDVVDPSGLLSAI